MNIAYITLGFRPFHTSGFDISGERIVQGLLEHGHSVTVIAATNGFVEEDFSHPSLKVVRLPLGKSDWIGYAFRAARMLKSLGSFDVVHFGDVQFAYAYSGRFVTSLHQSFRQRLAILDLTGQSIMRRFIVRVYYLLAISLIEPRAAKKAAGLLAVSQEMRNEFINTYHVPGEKIRLTRHGIDVNHFFPRQNNMLIRQNLGLRDDEPMILFAGFITPRKGLEYLAEAFPLIQPTPRFVFVGKWRSEDYRKRVLARFGPYADHILELGYISPENDRLSDLYSAADVYVSCSLTEGFGLPLGEALACGTPVVAFKSGSVEEVVGPGGILVEPCDVNGLAAGISHLLQNPEIRNSLSEKGRQYIMREFNVEKSIQSILDAYHYFLGVDR